MTVAEFIKDLETKASDMGLLNDDIISIGTGMNTTDNYYVIKTKEMSRNESINIVYWSDK